MTTVTPSSTLIITLAFTDEDGVAVAPATATWKLTDSSETVINSRSAVAISPLAASVDIVLHGADLAKTDDSRRVLTVTGTYDSDLSVANLEFVHQVGFDIGGMPGSA